MIALEAAHSAWVAHTAQGVDVPAERFGFDIKARQLQQVEEARVPGTDVRGAGVDKAMDAVVIDAGVVAGKRRPTLRRVGKADSAKDAA